MILKIRTSVNGKNTIRKRYRIKKTWSKIIMSNCLQNKSQNSLQLQRRLRNKKNKLKGNYKNKRKSRISKIRKYRLKINNIKMMMCLSQQKMIGD